MFILIWDDCLLSVGWYVMINAHLSVFVCEYDTRKFPCRAGCCSLAFLYNECTDERKMKSQYLQLPALLSFTFKFAPGNYDCENLRVLLEDHNSHLREAGVRSKNLKCKKTSDVPSIKSRCNSVYGQRSYEVRGG